MRLDARIAVRVVTAGNEGVPSAEVALLRLGVSGKACPSGWATVRLLPERAVAGHEANCRCCAGRSELADMMMRLFTERAKGQVNFFKTVLISVPGSLVYETVANLAYDPVIAGRYKVES